MITSSCTFQRLCNSESPESSLLQRQAFAAWAELDIQMAHPDIDSPARGNKNHHTAVAATRMSPSPPLVNTTPPPADTLVIYPDGSFHANDKGRTGCGFVIVTGGDGNEDTKAIEVVRGWKSLPRGSNNTAELSAGVEALKWILKYDHAHTRPVLIRFDS